MGLPKKKILVIGELNVDLIMDQLHGEPEYGKEQKASEMNLVMGSSSAIFACNIAALGTPASFAGMVGDDMFGKFVHHSLVQKGVNIDHVKTSKTAKTGVTVAFNKADERLMVTHPGAMELFGQDDLAPSLFNEFDHLHISSIFFQPQLKKDLASILQSAKEAGLTTSMDVQWDPEEVWDLDLTMLLGNIDLFMPNETELLNLTGSETPDEALQSVAEFDTKFVIKQGRKGSLYQHKGRRLTQDAFFLDGFADAIGAGDSFNAGYIHAYLHGEDPEECLKQGSITAAVSTLQPGGTAAIKSYQQVQKYPKQKS